MLNEKQKEWIQAQADCLKREIEDAGPLKMNDEQWDHVCKKITHIVSLAKGHEKEVREILFDAIVPYDLMTQKKRA